MTTTDTDTDTAQGWCCSDCLMLFANGETPPELNEADTAAWVTEINRICEGYRVTLGMLASEHEDDCPNVDHENDRWLGVTDCSCEEQSFSWSQCDTCHTRLGSSRHAVTFWPVAVSS